ncbi:competence protein ComF [Defluviimonas sp. 20V17]|uniref:Amidophosphoribosyltransferase n=1 Tax=Allgaiera indica TaxID=765699 RepID=A0AAN4ZY10_9RHOB|nr:ComF family protein [Allgaiera indica]KDB03582.1 competence protein ComF [Defluviimonas sp. 20V17]GHD98346.1 amidophosphoribosyltransferase [Allgaiera indica]SDW49038.1 comF family protein [Allgaiera indica]
MQTAIGQALHLIYPPQCLSCDALVTTDFGLCGACWRDTPFIAGLTCDKCGAPLPGETNAGSSPECCDDCLTVPRPWHQGRAALLYRDNGRRLVLALKHGDRQDLARPAAIWLARAARPILTPDMLIAPVPLHWRRLLTRRFNQAALISAALSRELALDHCPDLLSRTRRTPSQEGRDRDDRFSNLAEALAPHPRRGARARGRHVLLVDDVMTSGATLSAAAEACRSAGARAVSVLALARVVKD